MPSTMLTNPLQALLRGPSSTPGGASSPPPGASPGSPLNQMMGSLFSQQQGADPDYILKTLTTMRTALGEMIPKAMMSVEGVAADLGGILPRFDKAIERLKKAAQAQALARPPIGFSAAQSSPAQSGMGGGGMSPQGGIPQPTA